MQGRPNLSRLFDIYPQAMALVFDIEPNRVTKQQAQDEAGEVRPGQRAL